MEFFHNSPESEAKLNHLQLHLGPSFCVQFMGDNQATITIHTTIKIPNRAQGVSFRTNQFDLAEVSTSYQVADLLAKPFYKPSKMATCN